MNKSLSPAGLLSAILMGALATALTIGIWSVVHTLSTPLVIEVSIPRLLLIGAALGLLWALVRERFGGRYLHSWALGALMSVPWFAFAHTVTPGIAVGAVAAFALAGRVTAGSLRGIPMRKLRQDHVEELAVRVLRTGALVFFVSIVLFPFLFMISSSFKTRAEYLRDPLNLGFNVFQPPAQLFNGYIEVLTRFNFGAYIFNSAIIALATVVVTLVPAILGAYAVTRLKFPGRQTLSKSILLIYMFPAIVLVIPLYSVFTQLGLRDTRLGLLIVYSAMTIPVALYMLRSYFQTLPRDLEEAALIDGLSRFGVILQITLPLSVPAIASVGLYVFMIAWNEFLFAFMFLDSPGIFTLSRGMIMLDDQEVPRQFLMAGATVITVPIMFLFFRFQRLLVGGLTAGGVKG